MKASLIFFPNTQKTSARNGKVPMYVRVIINRTKAEGRLLAEVSQTDLLKWDPLTMRFTDRGCLANHILNGHDQKFLQFITINYEKLQDFNARQILDHILGQESKPKHEVIKYCEDYFRIAVSCNSNITKGTIKNYRKAINHLKAFLTHRKTETLEIANLNNAFAAEFKDYLVGNIPGKATKGMTEPSAAGIVKKFRTIFDRAIVEGLMDKNPFKTVKLKHRSPRRGRLSMGEILRVIQLDLGNMPAQKVYRDMFIFSVFTGLAYQDSMNVTYSNLITTPSGDIKLNIDRTKTGVITEQFLVTQVLEIIERYKITTERRKIVTSVLPYRSNKEVNLQLKYLAQLANIPMSLSTHILRHSYRQLLAEAGIEDMAVIKRMMGHTRSSDIDDVYYLVTDSKLLAAKEKFQSYLNRFL